MYLSFICFFRSYVSLVYIYFSFLCVSPSYLSLVPVCLSIEYLSFIHLLFTRLSHSYLSLLHVYLSFISISPSYLSLLHIYLSCICISPTYISRWNASLDHMYFPSVCKHTNIRTRTHTHTHTHTHTNIRLLLCTSLPFAPPSPLTGTTRPEWAGFELRFLRAWYCCVHDETYMRTWLTCMRIAYTLDAQIHRIYTYIRMIHTCIGHTWATGRTYAPAINS